MINVEVTFQKEAGPIATPEITATLAVEKPAPVPGTSQLNRKVEIVELPFSHSF